MNFDDFSSGKVCHSNELKEHHAFRKAIENKRHDKNSKVPGIGMKRRMWSVVDRPCVLGTTFICRGLHPGILRQATVNPIYNESNGSIAMVRYSVEFAIDIYWL
jgi:hypothetical protein